jgi:N-acetylmuramoyl-L-alanine amidase
MNRLRVKAGNGILAIALVLGATCSGVRAQTPPAPAAGSPNYWFAGTRLAFDRPQFRGRALAVASDDFGLGRFLTKLNAVLSYQPGQSYVVVTSGDHRTITFALGDPHYEVAGLTQTASFAPYLSGGSVYLPFAELARALDVLPVDDGGTTTVMQPQLAALDVRPDGRVTVVTLRGASTLHFKRLLAGDDGHLSLAFTGIASTLERERRIADGPLQGLAITVGGTPRNPTTVVDFGAVPYATHVLVPSDSPNAISLAFAPPGVTLGGTVVPETGDASVAVTPLVIHDPRDPVTIPSGAYRGGQAVVPPAPPIPVAALPVPFSSAPAGGAASSAGPVGLLPAGAPTPTALGLQPASVNDLRLDPVDEGLNIALGITGAVTYEWHRLSDNRWYVDLKPATLAMDAQDVPVTNEAVLSLRIKGFIGPTDHLPTVRVALTLATPRIVNLVATNAGATIAVDRLDDLEPLRTGIGEISGGRLVASIVPLPAAPPVPDGGSGAGAPSGWKFGPQLPPDVNPRLIVIDPGHGGSDRGAMHNGLVEAVLNLDMARRLRTLLVARGWTVKMTRDTDVDVYQPNDSARDELQARCDVANNAGARLFISIHSNSFTTSELNGTTTYYYKADSYGLADAVHARLAANLPTQDDGIRKENFYVIHHTSAPAILVESAFVSNPSDAQYLHSEAFLQKVAASIASGVGDYASPSQPVGANGAADPGGN